MSQKCTSVTIGIDTPDVEIGDLKVQRETVFKVPMPMKCNEGDLKIMKTDLELLKSVIEGNPKEFASLMESVAKGDAATAKLLSNGLGLSEEDFKSQGGGWLWVIAAGAVLVYSQKAY